MEFGILVAALLMFIGAVVAAGVYSRTEHCFFAMREARRQLRRLGYRRRRQWDY
jgi:hypothetical protein